ncbi:hypothetical protein G9A89_015057 [Geosiphon pyriformis]|nr:hypothetical protein G9A89_015057 [Geosiphon pyriformis]
MEKLISSIYIRNDPKSIRYYKKMLVDKQAMNIDPSTLLAYAKYFGEAKMPISVRMTSIDSNGFIALVKNEDGTGGSSLSKD